MATCAVCERPIDAGRFLLVGTEVVHRACVGQVTIGQRQQQEIARLQYELARAIGEGQRQAQNAQLRFDREQAIADRLAELEDRIPQLESRCGELAIRAGKMLEENKRVKREVAEERSARQRETRLRESAADRIAALDNARIAALRELEAARGDLARLRPDPTAPVDNEPEDGAAMRFSLLELDRS